MIIFMESSEIVTATFIIIALLFLAIAVSLTEIYVVEKIEKGIKEVDKLKSIIFNQRQPNVRINHRVLGSKITPAFFEVARRRSNYVTPFWRRLRKSGDNNGVGPN